MRTLAANPDKGLASNLLKRRTDAESECTEDGRDGRIGAMEYAEGNGTWKRGGDAEHIT